MSTRFAPGLASAHNALGIVRANAGKPAEAETEYRSAVTILQKLAENNPDATRYRNLLAMCRNNLGILLIQTGKPREAESEYRTALALRQKLVDDDPHDIELQHYLADTRDNLGSLLSQTGRPADAEAECRGALAILQKLTGDNREVPDLRRDMARCLTNIGGFLTEQGQIEEAVETYERRPRHPGHAEGQPPRRREQPERPGIYLLGSRQGPPTRKGICRSRGGPPAGRRTLGGVGRPWWDARYELACNHALLAGLAARASPTCRPPTAWPRPIVQWPCSGLSSLRAIANRR